MGSHEITHRELIGGVLTAIIALAEKQLTGERFTLYVQTAAGAVPICGVPVEWSTRSPTDNDQGGSRHNVAPTEDAITWARLPRYQMEDSPAP
jgi:hypothetical protein